MNKATEVGCLDLDLCPKNMLFSLHILKDISERLTLCETKVLYTQEAIFLEFQPCKMLGILLIHN